MWHACFWLFDLGEGALKQERLRGKGRAETCLALTGKLNGVETGLSRST